jgi:hypothetical protein
MTLLYNRPRRPSVPVVQHPSHNSVRKRCKRGDGPPYPHRLLRGSHQEEERPALRQLQVRQGSYCPNRLPGTRVFSHRPSKRPTDDFSTFQGLQAAILPRPSFSECPHLSPTSAATTSSSSSAASPSPLRPAGLAAFKRAAIEHSFECQYCDRLRQGKSSGQAFIESNTPASSSEAGPSKPGLIQELKADRCESLFSL